MPNRILVLTAALVVLAGAAGVAAQSARVGEIAIEDASVETAVGRGAVAVAVMRITNGAEVNDRLYEASSPLARAVELVSTESTDAIALSRQVRAIPVPSGTSVMLRRGGAYLLLVGLVRPLAKGDRVPLRLLFEEAGTIEVKAVVTRIGWRGPPSGR
ncbi:MAG: copper chaperone PCu(A)C [Proteobacteria bacterium]|nr:copper chaperone PCu(A)C [Pseudomonadota bacterium]